VLVTVRKEHRGHRASQTRSRWNNRNSCGEVRRRRSILADKAGALQIKDKQATMTINVMTDVK